MFPAFSAARRPSIFSPVKGIAIAAILAAAALFAAPREAHALFDDQAFSASYDSYLASWTAWYSDGGAVEGSYQYWATVYTYYGYVYAAYGDWYDYDPYYAYANFYHEASAELWEALLFYGMGGYDTYIASTKASAAAEWCYFAYLF